MTGYGVCPHCRTVLLPGQQRCVQCNHPVPGSGPPTGAGPVPDRAPASPPDAGPVPAAPGDPGPARQHEAWGERAAERPDSSATWSSQAWPEAEEPISSTAAPSSGEWVVQETLRDEMPRIPRRTWMISGAVLAGIAALFVGRAVIQSFVFTPEMAVRDYFAALADRDAEAAARAMVPTADRPRSNPLMRNPVLRDKRYTPPTHARIVQVTADERHEDLKTARVQVRIGSRSRVLDIGVERESDTSRLFFHRWRVSDSAVGTLVVAAPGADAARINGVQIIRGESEDGASGTGTGPPPISAAAFPGRYTVGLSRQPLLTAAPRQAYVTGPAEETSMGEPRPTVTLAPKVKPTAVTTVRRKIKRYLDHCATSRAEAPENCPFHSYQFGSVSATHWKITQYPQITLRRESDGNFAVRTTAQGAATFSGQSEDFLDHKKPFSEQVNFSVDGPVRIRQDTLVWTHT